MIEIMVVKNTTILDQLTVDPSLTTLRQLRDLINPPLGKEWLVADGDDLIGYELEAKIMCEDSIDKANKIFFKLTPPITTNNQQTLLIMDPQSLPPQEEAKSIEKIVQKQSEVQEEEKKTAPLLSQAIQGANILRIQNGLQIYKYPSQKLNHLEQTQAKVLMMVGQTGSGKTTLINFLINYYMGIKFSDPFRYELISEVTGKSQALSQTEEVTIYEIKSYKRQPPLKIVDTPGFGDTRGLPRDKIIASQIYQFFKTKLDSIHCICFVAQASNARLTVPQNYIFGAILEMFGRDIAENFMCMITFSDAQIPRIVEALTYRGQLQEDDSIFIPLIDVIKAPWYLKFNNSALYATNSDEFADISSKFWDMGIKSCDKFMLQKLQILSAKSLMLTNTIQL